MRNNIYVVTGHNGAGKSLVAMALIDFLRRKGVEVLVVETDTDAPDVGKTYRSMCRVEGLNLNLAEGWIDLVDVAAAHPHHAVVINAAPRSLQAFIQFGGTLGVALPELRRRLVTCWVLSQRSEGLEWLSAYRKALPFSAIHVLRNARWGSSTTFAYYDESELRVEVEREGGRASTFPALASSVCDVLFNLRLPISADLEGERCLPLGSRAELRRWRDESAKGFETMLGPRSR